MINSHNHAINRLEAQISQLANSLSERQKEALLSQPLTNPKNSFPIMRPKIHSQSNATLFIS